MFFVCLTSLLYVIKPDVLVSTHICRLSLKNYYSYYFKKFNIKSAGRQFKYVWSTNFNLAIVELQKIKNANVKIKFILTSINIIKYLHR